ncbi:MAG: DUF3095 domain-containing protein [Rhizobiales bacterium]|nr:DUF3095 domain-containing protein [Hyphomicrobiales bacterium]
MDQSWVTSVPVLERFSEVADPSRYRPLPDDWLIGVSDVEDSTAAITNGRYKAVNLAGAATISAISNALPGQTTLFTFGGDGAHFALSPAQAPVAAEALASVASWAARDLGLNLRVGMTGIHDVRAAGLDVRVAFWRASDHVRYAMFTGGGLEWSETQLKTGAIGLPAAAANSEPDLTGLSCQWAPIRARQGAILSLIVKQARHASHAQFAEIAARVIEVLEDGSSLNPVPAQGPEVRWPSHAMALQSRVANHKRPAWWRRMSVLATSALYWTVFRLGRRIGRFDPSQYRRDVALNTDFRKFDDGLMMTVDCSTDTAARLRTLLEKAAGQGIIQYGLHMQDEALMTCVVPSALASDHMHFVDGSGGGYTSAARNLRG